MSDLNRRVLELMGWRMKVTAHRKPFHYWTLFNADDYPEWSALGENASEDEAWESALSGSFTSGRVFPDYSGDPAAAIALLAGLRWHATGHDDGVRRIDIQFVADNHVYEGGTEVINGDEARAFAEAATQAWCEWREAGK